MSRKTDSVVGGVAGGAAGGALNQQVVNELREGINHVKNNVAGVAQRYITCIYLEIYLKMYLEIPCQSF